MTPDTITDLSHHDVRVPTSRTLAGSDALNLAPDYSTTYVVARTAEDGPSRHGLGFTNGRGNEICVTAVEALRRHVEGRSLAGIFDDLNGFWRSLVRDTQLRWLGPEKGIIHMGTAAIVNAVWDLEPKRRGMPMWKLLADMEALADGFTHLRIKVGGEPEDDLRRARLLREIIGTDGTLTMDANQRWDVGEAISRMEALAEVAPWWIEEPTNPDDVLGHARIAEAVAPIEVATGRDAHNRVMFKQLLQAGGMGIVQADACRVAGVNEVLAVLLLAAKFDKPVCPHAGGVGLCVYVHGPEWRKP